MSYKLHRLPFQQSHPFASVCAPFRSVLPVGDGSDLAFGPISHASARPFGYVEATAPLGENQTVYEPGNVVIAIAGASLGAGVPVGIASTNGALGPSVASGMWEHGISQTPAAAGERFALLIQPRQKVN